MAELRNYMLNKWEVVAEMPWAFCELFKKITLRMNSQNEIGRLGTGLLHEILPLDMDAF